MEDGFEGMKLSLKSEGLDRAITLGPFVQIPELTINRAGDDSRMRQRADRALMARELGAFRVNVNCVGEAAKSN